MEALIRLARATDAQAIAPLLHELGHPQTPAMVAERLEALARQGGSTTLVAERAGNVLGLVSAQSMLVLHRVGPLGRITALVVRSGLIGVGVGTQLLRAAEAFLVDAGCTRIEVTSASHRAGAHAFYLKRGYERQGERFSRRVGRDPE